MSIEHTEQEYIDLEQEERELTDKANTSRVYVSVCGKSWG
jgi:hypothetical protein